MLVNIKVEVWPREMDDDGVEIPRDLSRPLRMDERAMENNAGHQEELALMLDGIVKTIKADLGKNTRDQNIEEWYIVRVSRMRDELPEPA